MTTEQEVAGVPTSPPAQPIIPIGFGSKLGFLSGGLMGIAALVTAVLNGDHTAETLGALASAVVMLAVTVAGRAAQAYAIYRDSPSAGIAAALDAFTDPTPSLPTPSSGAPPRIR